MSTETDINSIGIIIDGNRRWARARGLPTIAGHHAGFEALRTLIEELPRLKRDYGIMWATIYTFSTENWNRSSDEVSYLMKIFKDSFKEIAESVGNTRVRFIGQRERFSEELQQLMHEVESKTAQNTGVTVSFALSYGGRADLLNAIQKLRESDDPLDEATLSGALSTAGIPDPDLIVRTSGEQRLSNFLPWESVYSELFFTDTLWPNFTVEELERIFTEFQARERRRGK